MSKANFIVVLLHAMLNCLHIVYIFIVVIHAAVLDLIDARMPTVHNFLVAQPEDMSIVQGSRPHNSAEENDTGEGKDKGKLNSTDSMTGIEIMLR